MGAVSDGVKWGEEGEDAGRLGEGLFVKHGSPLV